MLPALDPAGFPPSPLPAGRVRGPAVFLDYDQAELDAVYDQNAYAPNRAQVLARYASASDEVRRRIGAPKRLRYGPSAIEQLDWFASDAKNAPVLVFVHGGAWRSGAAAEYAFPAEFLVRSGVHCVVPDYTNVIEQQGNLMPMAQQVQAALAWVIKNASLHGGDAQRVYVCGHSSGAHLVSAALVGDWRAGDWQASHGLAQTAIRGGLLISGMYDLRGPRLSARSQYVNFTDAIEDALSAQRHIARVQVPLTLVYGSMETPEFQRQSWSFAQALQQAGKPVRLIRAEGYNHFEIAETLASPFAAAGRAALAMMGLGDE